MRSPPELRVADFFDDPAWAADHLVLYAETARGQFFDPLAASSPPNVFTPADFVAVEFLSVSVPSDSAAWMLFTKAKDELSDLLAKVPMEPIWQVGRETLEPGSPLDQLWHRVQHGTWRPESGKPRLGEVTAGKLLAAKRPALVPILDDRIRKALAPRASRFWLEIHDQFADPELRAAVRAAAALAAERNANVGSLSLLRLADIVIWRATELGQLSLVRERAAASGTSRGTNYDRCGGA